MISMTKMLNGDWATMGSVSVGGGEERTSASRYALEDTDEVRIILDRLRTLVKGVDG